MNRLARVPTWFVAAGAVFVAFAAFRLAYGGSKGAALDAGISPDAAGWYPWCIEGVIVVASTATVALPSGERRLAWLVLLGFTGISCSANVLHALDVDGHRWWSPAFAVVPPLALPLCVRLAEKVALRAVHRTVPDSPSGDQYEADDLYEWESTESADAASGGALYAVREEGPDCAADAPPDGPPTVHEESGTDRPDAADGAVPDGSEPQSGRSTGRVRKASAKESTRVVRTLPDWRTSAWSAVAQARGISRTKAFTVVREEGPDAVRDARRTLAERAQSNGHGPKVTVP